MEQANNRLLELSGLDKNTRHNALMHDKGVVIVKVHASLIANSIQPIFSTKGWIKSFPISPRIMPQLTEHPFPGTVYKCYPAPRSVYMASSGPLW